MMYTFKWKVLKLENVINMSGEQKKTCGTWISAYEAKFPYFGGRETKRNDRDGN